LKGKREQAELIQQVHDLDERVYWTVNSMLPDSVLRLGLTNIQVKVLRLLSASGPLRMGDLASALGKNGKTTTGIVDRLVGRGLLVRENDANDRRVVYCKLSDKGWGVRNQIFQVGEADRKRVSSYLKEKTEEELSHLAAALEQVDAHFKKIWESISVDSPANREELSKQGQRNRQR
jgi:DNA-binding MarR family transcriptional regulator